MKLFALTLILIFACAFLVAPSAAQIVTGTLTGHVSDPTGAAVTEAALELVEPATGLTRSATTDSNGEFVIGGLNPGDYSLVASKSGFKKLQRADIHVDAGQRLVLGDLKMELGNVTETVSVTGEMGAVVASQSAERSDLITSRQVGGLLNLGRNVTSLVQLLPGVVLTASSDSLGRTSNFYVNGSRETQNSVNIDGVPSTDVGNAFDLKINVSQDSVSEVKVMLSNYQAEYGRAAGSNVSIVTKSGTRQYHGLVSYYKRNEEFNANNFFNNRNGVPIPRYRYNAWTYNIGGPVYIPKLWNRDRSKMFFFWGQEFWPTNQGTSGSLTVPTALERNGDFSQSLDVSNRLYVIKDPQSGQPFPGNVIPSNRLDPNGQALLKVFPQPNFFARNVSRGNYNYVFTTNTNNPIHTNTFKSDYIFNEKNTLTFSYNGFDEFHEGSLNFATAASNWPQWIYNYYARTATLAARYTHVFTPSLLNEFHVGMLHLPEGNGYDPSALTPNQRKTVGFNTGQFYPANNPLNLIPAATFGGVPSPANLAYDGRFPLYGITNVVNFDEKLTWNRSRHTIKAGAYVEWFQRDIGQPVDFAGNLDFGASATNPLDTGYAYSNAALGVFNAYDEASARSYPQSRDILLELFAQDNWRVTSRFTLDYGVRVYYMPPITEINNQLVGFNQSRFDPAKSVSLIAPGLNAAGQRVGISPVNGQTYPATLIGAIAPGKGSPTDGLVVAAQDSTYPRALTDTHALNFGPRFGFAYDVFGNGHTAIRGGFGIFYNRPNFGTWLRPFNAQPPLVQTPIINYGTLSSLLSSSGLLFPTNVIALDPHAKIPQVMDFSFGVQHSLGWGTVLDVGYIGSLGRHLLWVRPLNAIPFGTDFQAANLDKTAANKPLPPAFLRPIVGYNNINQTEPAGSSNYHSLQVTVNRRFQKGLQFGGSWTWSKALDYNDEDNQTISTLVPIRVWNYSMAAFDRTHNLRLNWLFDVPSPHGNRVLRQALGGWQLSGVTAFISGAPVPINFATTTPSDITGSPTDLPRIQINGNPVLEKGDRTFAHNFNTGVFSLPPVGSIGNAPRTVLRGPGLNNWDLALFKNFPVFKERARLQFRSEFYNAFNHTQFTQWDTTARFDAAGNQVNGSFGQATAAAAARILQFSLRAYF
jgi:hypothetical protein